jgi:hypothetical protein
MSRSDAERGFSYLSGVVADSLVEFFAQFYDPAPGTWPMRRTSADETSVDEMIKLWEREWARLRDEQS